MTSRRFALIPAVALAAMIALPASAGDGKAAKRTGRAGVACAPLDVPAAANKGCHRATPCRLPLY